MSWSTFMNPVPAADFETALREMPDPIYYGPDGERVAELPSEMRDQVEAAKAGALAIFQSQAVGDHSGLYLYGVNMSGHANPGHAPREHWSNEVVNINVYQAVKLPANPDLTPLGEPDSHFGASALETLTPPEASAESEADSEESDDSDESDESSESDDDSDESDEDEDDQDGEQADTDTAQASTSDLLNV